MQTVATKVHTLAINSGIGARIKDIALYIQSLAMKAKDIIQTGLEIAAKAAHTVATNIATAAQAALNLVMSLNPIGIIIIAIVALIAAFTLLFLKCKPFHDWVISAFNNIRNVVLSVFGEIQAFITNSIDNIKQIFNGIIEFFTGVFTGNWKKAFQGLQDIVGGIFGQIVNVVKTPINIMIDLINGLIGNINNVIKLASNIPGIGGALKGVAIPKIPKLAHGGIIDSPTVAMLGEAGREAVVPLENTGFVTAIASAVASAVSSAIHGGSGTNGSGDVNVTLQVDRDVLGRATINAINSQIRRTGVIPLNI